MSIPISMLLKPWLLLMNPLFCVQTARWVIRNLMEPQSPLAYSMLRFDAGVGVTDSPRLVQVKQQLHFETLPRLVDSLLACQDQYLSGKRFDQLLERGLEQGSGAKPNKASNQQQDDVMTDDAVSSIDVDATMPNAPNSALDPTPVMGKIPASAME